MAWREVTARGPAGRIAGALIGALWWWAALRLTLEPRSAGTVEGAVVLGGWGLSLLPVHCVPWAGPGDGAGGRGISLTAGRAALGRAWRRRRGGRGAGRS